MNTQEPTRSVPIADDTPKPKRTRFTIRGLLIAVIIVAMSLALGLAYRELIPLRREVKRLRDQAGILTIEENSKLNAIAIETYTPIAWKWKVWIPADKHFRLRFAAKEVPIRGAFPARPATTNIVAEATGREIEIVAKIEKRIDGSVRLAVTQGPGTMYASIDPQNAGWLLTSSGSTTQGVGKMHRLHNDRDKPLVLLRKRFFYTPGTIPPTPNPKTTDGVMIWIDEVRNPN